MNLFSASTSQFSLTLTVDEESEKTSDTDSNPIPTNENKNLERKKENVMAVRKLALSNLQKQANKMLDVSSAKYPMAAIGDTVRVRVPDIDRARSDGRNMLATVIEVIASNLYKLGTKQGVLNQLYSRNQFTVCKERFISPEDVPETEISLRECCRMSSKCGGQGYSRCGCKSGCKSDKCSCRKAKKLCTSKCHHSGSCSNK